MYFLPVFLIFAQDTAMEVLDYTYTSSELHWHANYTSIFDAKGAVLPVSKLLDLF